MGMDVAHWGETGAMSDDTTSPDDLDDATLDAVAGGSIKGCAKCHQPWSQDHVCVVPAATEIAVAPG